LNNQIIPYPQLSKSSYRADIDGLRGLQILALIGFHGFPTIVTGGYVGVSIFFVISGYLISSIIFKSLNTKNSIDFFDFYIRRTRRIFPALIVILIAASLLGWILMLPDEYKQLGEYIIGGATFLDNFVAWSQIDYFDERAELKPLLHLWSLGIEEQFYLFWPFSLWVAWRLRFNLLAITILATTISFILSIYGITENPASTFYAPWTRMWEILIGGILAYIHLYHPEYRFKKNAVLTNIFSFVGLSLLFYGIFFYTKQTIFPGPHALIPVIGALLIIAGGESSWINKRILANKIMIWFGVISYPLYLWHWTLISFTRVVDGGESPVLIRCATIVCSIAFSWFTYKAIEDPIRFGGRAIIKSLFLLLCLLLLASFGAYIYLNQGIPNRVGANPAIKNKGDVGHDDFHQYPYNKFILCTPKKIQNEALRWSDGSIRCFQSKSSGKIDIAIIGDSHAEHLFLGLAESLPNKNIAYYVKGGRPFSTNPDFRNIFEYVESDKNIKIVIYTAWWGNIFQGGPADREMAYKDLNATIKSLSDSGKKIFITDDIPDFKTNPKQCKYSRRLSSADLCSEKSLIFFDKHSVYIKYLEKISSQYSSVNVINTAQYFCDTDECSMKQNNELVYRDLHHLNINGSKYLAKKILEQEPRLMFD
jgi:peptidoglycan/LPS O-acetylase OafA/YrhL